MRLRDYLDADWARLSSLSSPHPRKRKIRDTLHPRFAPVVVLRCAQVLDASGWRRFSKLFSLLNMILFGMEVPASLDIGPGLVITHTNGSGWKEMEDPISALKALREKGMGTH